ncbi:MAG: putative TonB-dependent receptor [Rhodanobacteraceae bacterium]|jgi:protein TonB|nr:MAG: putative TonB-dependent receptor [Rhodanobacteraceae bacterium]
MATPDSSLFESGFFGFAGALRGLAMAACAAMLLAGCGKGQGPASSAPAAPPASTVPAPKASAPAELPAAAPASAASAARAQAAAQSKLAKMSVEDLLAAARNAYAQHQLVAPAGDNAMEYYEAVLAKDPNNQVAKDALRETFPFTVPDVEKAISQNNFDEANREIDLLAKASPTNYTLTLLRSKLDAQKKLQARQQQEAQAKTQKAAQLAAAQQAAAQQAAAQQAAAAKLAAEKEAAAKQATRQAAAAVPKPAVPPKPVGETRAAKVLAQASPEYPLQAARNQTSGYAVVEFTVSATGAVEDAHIVESSPRRVFDSAAIQAVKRSKFAPALKDGQPVESVLQRRIDFKFGG